MRLLQTVDAYVRSVLLSLFHYFDRKDEFSGPRSSFFFLFEKKTSIRVKKSVCMSVCVRSFLAGEAGVSSLLFFK